MIKTIQGRHVAHDFKNSGGWSPTCEWCGVCDCFGNNTKIIYGYKQIVEKNCYYCNEHIKTELENNKYTNDSFIRLENEDLTLKNKPILIDVKNIKGDKIINSHEKMCAISECKNKENLTNISYFYADCVCENCAPSNKEIYFKRGWFDNNNFDCPDCNIKLEIKFDLNENTEKYCYVSCDDPYKVIELYDNENSFILQEFCKEIKPKGYIIKPLAIKRKKKSRNVEDLTIPENIVTNETFKQFDKNKLLI